MAAPVLAQGTTGSISGFVTDQTNAALPGATVTVRHVETDQKRVIVLPAPQVGVQIAKEEFEFRAPKGVKVVTP